MQIEHPFRQHCDFYCFFPFLFSRFNRFRHVLYRIIGPIVHSLMSEKNICVRFEGDELQ